MSNPSRLTARQQVKLLQEQAAKEEAENTEVPPSGANKEEDTVRSLVRLPSTEAIWNDKPIKVNILVKDTSGLSSKGNENENKNDNDNMQDDSDEEKRPLRKKRARPTIHDDSNEDEDDVGLDEELQNTSSEAEGDEGYNDDTDPRSREKREDPTNKKQKTSLALAKEQPTVPRKGGIPRRKKDVGIQKQTEEKNRGGSSSLIRSMEAAPAPPPTAVAKNVPSSLSSANRSNKALSSAGESSPKKPKPAVTNNNDPKIEIEFMSTTNANTAQPPSAQPQARTKQQILQQQEKRKTKAANLSLIHKLEGLCSSLLDNTHFQLVLSTGTSTGGSNIDLAGSFSRDEEQMYDFFDLNQNGEIEIPPKIAIFPEEFPPGMKEHSLHWWGIVDPAVGARSSSSGSSKRGRDDRGDHRRGDRDRRPPLLPHQHPGRSPHDFGPSGGVPPPPSGWNGRAGSAGGWPDGPPPPGWSGRAGSAGDWPDGPPPPRGFPDGPPPWDGPDPPPPYWDGPGPPPPYWDGPGPPLPYWDGPGPPHRGGEPDGIPPHWDGPPPHRGEAPPPPHHRGMPPPNQRGRRPPPMDRDRDRDGGRNRGGRGPPPGRGRR